MKQQLNEVQRLKELAGMKQSITIDVPEDTSYEEFANAVADYLDQHYGAHNFQSFLKALQAALSAK